MAEKLITIQDLAKRWGITLRQAKATAQLTLGAKVARSTPERLNAQV